MYNNFLEQPPGIPESPTSPGHRQQRRGVSPVRDPFKNDSLLQPYILSDVTTTGKMLGVGSYGSVFEVEHMYLTCAAKKMHETLLIPGYEGVQDLILKYHEECQMMASLRHPNVTQFLGLCFLEESQLPLLVMERLETNLDDLLENVPNLSLALKISVLCDTCNGLIYLHTLSPPIIHRDLTAKNILLTSSFSAKISDLGNSRMVEFRSGQLAKTLSKLPGTLVYMPPEALDDHHRYGPSLDIFSFGHLGLFTLTQIFPGELLSSTYPDPNNPEKTKGRSEVERRDKYVQELHSMLGQSHPALVDLVLQCLHGAPDRRPSTKALLRQLQDIKVKDRKHGDFIDKHLNIAKILLTKQQKVNEKQLQDMTIAMESMGTENLNLSTSKRKLESDVASLIHQKQEIEAENRNIKRAHEELKTEYSSLVNEVERLKRLHVEKEQQISIQGESLAKMMKEKGDLQKVFEQAIFPLQLNWKRGPDMPFAMTGYVQAVAVGNDVFVGGGSADKKADDYTIMAYDLVTHKWRILPPYCAKYFAIVRSNDNVVLVGGQNNSNSNLNYLGVWSSNIQQWTFPYPPMPSARSYASATQYFNWLVVAGGWGNGGTTLSTVEVLNTDLKQWYTPQKMPFQWDSMKSVVIDKAWFLLGGSCGHSWTDEVYTTSLEELVSSLQPSHSRTTQNTWKKIDNLKHNSCSPVSLANTLLILGGRSDKNIGAVTTIHRYVPTTEEWLQAGQLPIPLYKSASITASDMLFLCGGHHKKKPQAGMYYCNIFHK